MRGLSRGLGGLRASNPRTVSIGGPLSGPLAVHTSGRYLTRNGSPFLLIGDTPWSLPIDCTTSQIDSYLADRQGKGCTAILFELIENAYSHQTPRYRNVNGHDPFTSLTGTPSATAANWTLSDAYWDHIDYLIDGATSRGIVSCVTPAYTGYGGGGDGWLTAYSAASDGTLQSYGAALATRYAGKPIIWVMGGDDANDGQAAGNYGSGTTPQRTKQWQIALGIRSVDANALITGHTARNGTGGVSGEAYAAWTSGYTGFNVNNTYAQETLADGPGLAATAYGRSGPMPFFMIEAGYENTDGSDGGGIIPAIQSVLGGALGGWFGGHDVLWHMGSYTPPSTVAAALSTYLSGSWSVHSNFGALLTSKEWWKLAPQTGTTLVTTAKGTGASTICPALASDGSFAMIWTPSANFTVDMTALSPSSVRARWWNYSDGAFTAASGSPFSNTGTQAFTAPGDRILVLDAA